MKRNEKSAVKCDEKKLFETVSTIAQRERNINSCAEKCTARRAPATVQECVGKSMEIRGKPTKTKRLFIKAAKQLYFTSRQPAV